MTGVGEYVVLFAEDWDSGVMAWSTQRAGSYADDSGAAASLVAATARSHRRGQAGDAARGAGRLPGADRDARAEPITAE